MTVRHGNYNHPYKPYDIQLQLMDEIYDTIDKGYKVGLFESPTGTGKTLSMICSTMTWLRSHKNQNNDDECSSDDSEPEWVTEAYRKGVTLNQQGKLREYEQHLDKMALEYGQKLTRIHKLGEKRTKLSGNPEDDFIPDDYNSDSEVSTKDRNQILKQEINKLLSKVEGTSGSSIDVDTLKDDSTKIIFTSRTHTQLNQFSSLLTLPKFESSLDGIDERTKYIPLGSRKQLCVHSKISKMSNPEAINDACKDLNSKDGCEFLLNSRTHDIKQQFSDYSLTRIHDIEDLKSLGEHLKVCPYYSVRNNIQISEIISVPYQMLLEENTRQVLNINIKNAIIVVDEAHNLLDTISSLNSVAIKKSELIELHGSLKMYMKKFMKRLNSGNRINLMKLIKICGILISYINTSEANRTIKNGSTITPESIFQESTGDLFNVHKLNQYLKTSRIAFKIENYLENTDNNSNHSKSNPLLFKLTNFLRSLSNPSKEGRFFWDTQFHDNPSISYMLLDPSQVFAPIVDQCKCLVLAGGTMEPMEDYTDFLFPYLPQEKIKKFSCNHIIPDENLKTIPITSYENEVMDFLFKNRNNHGLINKLGWLLIKLIQKIPDGVVLFFPSYKLLNNIVQHWQASGLYQKLETVKNRIFLEPSGSNGVTPVLESYTQTIKSSNGKGAILLAVVGGKLSEGINFLDELARAVIMVGLPYPNLMSGELIAKKNFIYKTTMSKTASEQLASEASRQYVENICMRSVNQSVGRSIRHIKDYAMIYLIDQRYNQPNIQNKLSGWIKQQLLPKLTIDEIMNQTDDFFISKSITKYD